MRSSEVDVGRAKGRERAGKLRDEAQLLLESAWDARGAWEWGAKGTSGAGMGMGMGMRADLEMAQAACVRPSMSHRR